MRLPRLRLLLVSTLHPDFQSIVVEIRNDTTDPQLLMASRHRHRVRLSLFSFSSLAGGDGCRPLHCRDFGERHDKVSIMFLLKRSDLDVLEEYLFVYRFHCGMIESRHGGILIRLRSCEPTFRGAKYMGAAKVAQAA